VQATMMESNIVENVKSLFFMKEYFVLAVIFISVHRQLEG